MKKFTKISLIVCAALAGLGVIFCLVGGILGFRTSELGQMARNGVFSLNPFVYEWDHQEESWEKEESGKESGQGDWTQNTVSWPSETVKELDVEFDFGTLVLQPAETDEFEVTAKYRNIWGDYSRRIDCKMDGDTLKIRDTAGKKIRKLFSCTAEDARLVIRIPEDTFFEKISMKIGAAQVQLDTMLAAADIHMELGAGSAAGNRRELMLKADKVQLEIGAGSMELEGIQADELDVECGTGELSLSGVTARDVDVECGIGQITMGATGQQEDYDYEIQCGIGQVVLGNDSYSGLGQTRKISNQSSRFMSIDCGIGEIDITFSE